MEKKILATVYRISTKLGETHRTTKCIKDKFDTFLCEGIQSLTSVHNELNCFFCCWSECFPVSVDW